MNTKNTVYQIITDRILEALDKGTAPWHKPWRVSCYGGKCGSAWNLKTKQPYRGLNTFILSATSYPNPWWVTFKQAQSLGGNVIKGQTGTPIVFWKLLEVADEKSPTGKKKIPFLRYSTVFNVEQCEGLEGKVPQPDQPEGEPTGFLPIEAAESIVEGMPKRPEIKHGGSRAFYSPTFDRVGMPNQEDFESADSYYSTLFHELGHSTGHKSRLGRKGVDGEEGNWSPFGSPAYAKEELVAEMTAAFLCGECGLEGTFDSSAAYLAHWRRHISNDPTLVVHAASAAQKAADFILGNKLPARSADSKETVNA